MVPCQIACGACGGGRGACVFCRELAECVIDEVSRAGRKDLLDALADAVVDIAGSGGGAVDGLLCADEAIFVIVAEGILTQRGHVAGAVVRECAAGGAQLVGSGIVGTLCGWCELIVGHPGALAAGREPGVAESVVIEGAGECGGAGCIADGLYAVEEIVGVGLREGGGGSGDGLLEEVRLATISGLPGCLGGGRSQLQVAFEWTGDNYLSPSWR